VAISDRELIMVVTPHLVTPLAANASLPSLPGEKERNYDPDFGEFMFFETGRFDSTNATYGFSD
jgi:pilus assembly protein CpaC